jgi:hypothetical protein
MNVLTGSHLNHGNVQNGSSTWAAAVCARSDRVCARAFQPQRMRAETKLKKERCKTVSALGYIITPFSGA